MFDSPLPLETTPAEVQSRMRSGERIQLIDVREPAEHQVARIEDAQLIPMGDVPSRLQAIEQAADDATTVVVFCHHGVRSLHVANWLRGQGVENVQSMQGGIDRWSLEIDPGIPRYT
ncbi:MAG TPA: rhodanese-like domain-containing protein [Bryobacteraceae bacterium]|nr:rhodanese-like domain-containing protein [Bryobacteraceae bacterium]